MQKLSYTNPDLGLTVSLDVAPFPSCCGACILKEFLVEDEEIIEGIRFHDGDSYGCSDKLRRLSEEDQEEVIIDIYSCLKRALLRDIEGSRRNTVIGMGVDEDDVYASEDAYLDSYAREKINIKGFLLFLGGVVVNTNFNPNSRNTLELYVYNIITKEEDKYE